MKKLLIGLCATLLVFAGCGDDSDCVNCPSAENPTLENIWPNADSTNWVYDHTRTEWDADLTIYPTIDAVPDDPLPNWTEVFKYFETNVPPTATTTEAGTMTLRFDGETTTEADVTAQNLVQEIVIGSLTGRSPASQGGLLRRAIGSDLPVSSSGLVPMPPQGPIFLHGGAWKKTSSRIAMYGPFNQDPAWIYLTSNLFLGASFSIRPVPDIAPNVWLRGTVYRQVTVQTGIGTLKKALDCLYILDYGITAVTDPQGLVVGYIRAIDMGRVVYAPTVGPVFCYERLGVEPGETLTAGVADATEAIVETNVLDG